MDSKEPFWAPWPVEEYLDAQKAIELDAYKGTAALELCCTQLPGKASRQQRIVKEWCEFFHDPTPIRQLLLTTRVPIKLFEAICNQVKLTTLCIKWGPIKDLSPIAKLTNLKRLYLGSCSITDIRPISALTEMEHLFLGNLDRLSDYSPLAELTKLQYLQIEGDPWAPKDVWIDSLDFLPRLTKLRGLAIYAARFRDESFVQSILDSPQLEYLDLPLRAADVVRERVIKDLPNLEYGNVIKPT